jgi:hypothetical protein
VHNCISYIQERDSAQSRQSAMLFLQSSVLGLPQPLTRRRVCPSTFGSGGEGHTRWRERGLGESQFQRGELHCCTLYIYVLCGTVLGKKKEGMEKRGRKRLGEKWQRDYRNENNDLEQEVRKRK